MKEIKNLVGHRFNNYTVIEKAGPSYWLCRCDCGKISKYGTDQINKGKVKSCWECRNKRFKSIIIDGTLYGKLTVLHYIGINSKWHQTWLCRCDCGLECEVTGARLRTKHTTQCPKCCEYSPERFAKMSMIDRARRRAKRKSLAFNINVHDLEIPLICPLLGIPIILSPYHLDRNPLSTITRTQEASPNAPSLDRIDNSLGYIKGNVRVISYRANCLKNDSTSEERRLLVEHDERIYKTAA